MNIYLLKLETHDYDEFDGWVVIADNEEEVLELCNIRENEEECDRFLSNQYKGNIKSIKIIGIANDNQKKGIVLGSFNAG